MVKRKADRERRLLERVAYHEAGHEVFCDKFERKFHHVTIKPGEGSLGHILQAKFSSRFRPDIEITPKTQDTIQKLILIDMAGGSAEVRFSGRRSREGTGQDIHDAVGMAHYLFPSEVIGKYIDFATAHADRLVGNPRIWAQIEAVAADLLEHRILSGDQVREICRTVILDGKRIAELRAKG